MRLAVFAFSRRGMGVARQVMELPAQWRAFVPERLAEGDFAALLAPGCAFYDENHELSRNGKPDNRLKRLQEITNWFDRYLMPAT